LEVIKMNEENELLRVSEVAKVFDVSSAAIYSWVGHGKIPAYKLVGAIRLKKSDVQEWLKSKKRVFSLPSLMPGRRPNR
jgi:excisionase family DNA binding protein